MDKRTDRKLMENTVFYKDCYGLAEYIVLKECEKTQSYNKTGEKLFQLCSDMRSKYKEMFSSFVRHLDITKESLHQKSKNIMKKIINDNIFNFGRIVSIYTACLSICKFCFDNHILRDCIGLVFQATAEVMCGTEDWFQKNGSWVGIKLFC